MAQLDLQDADGQLAELIARVRAGEEIGIAEAGQLVARIVPAVDNPRRKGRGMYQGQVWISDDFETPLTEKELEEWGL